VYLFLWNKKYCYIAEPCTDSHGQKECKYNNVQRGGKHQRRAPVVEVSRDISRLKQESKIKIKIYEILTLFIAQIPETFSLIFWKVI